MSSAAMVQPEGTVSKPLWQPDTEDEAAVASKTANVLPLNTTVEGNVLVKLPEQVPRRYWPAEQDADVGQARHWRSRRAEQARV